MVPRAQGWEAPSRPLVTVVVLSYNRPHFLSKALQSIAQQTYPNLEVLVVDNPSPQSGAVRDLMQRYPSCRLISMDRNNGYAGGMNEGIRNAAGDYIYLSEDDMITEPGAITAMVDHMESDPQAGLASGIIDDHLGATIYAGGFTEIGPVFKQYLYGRSTPVLPPIAGPFCITYASGAMMMFRRSALEELGLFREDFFMYFEDVEICARFLKAGRSIVLVPTAKTVTLGEGPEKKDSPRVSFHKLKNLMAVSLLYIRPAEMPEFLLRYGVVNLLRHALRDRPTAWALLCADLWVAANFPRLMWDRRQFSKGQRLRERQLCSAGAGTI
jgi:GT2 family glycosyltransferase